MALSAQWRVIGNVVKEGRIYSRVQTAREEWLLREDEQRRLWRLPDSGTEVHPGVARLLDRRAPVRAGPGLSLFRPTEPDCIPLRGLLRLPTGSRSIAPGAVHA